MSQQNSKSASISPNGCGYGVLLMGIGLMGAIVIPTFLARLNQGDRSEVRLTVTSMSRAQQAYFAEKSAFGNSVEALGLGIKTETTNYKYSLRSTKQAAFNYGVSKQEKLKSWVGAVFAVPSKEVDPNAAKDEISTIRIFCQADSPGTIEPAEPIYQNGKLACGQGTTEVTK